MSSYVVPSTLLQAWRLRLSEWSIDGSLSAAAQAALRLKTEPRQLTALISQWAAGDFSALPPIKVLEGSVLPGTAGAYAISTGTIYLNGNWLQRASEEQRIAVLSEELGHHLDGLLNAEETPGDEGDHFSLLLRQVAIAPERLKAIRAEDDHTSLWIDGAWIPVEQATILGTLGDDDLVGSSGNDTINGLLGLDTIDGGAGSDTLIIDYSSNAFTGPLPPAGIASNIYNPNDPTSLNGYIYAYNSIGAIDEVEFINIERFQITGTGVSDQIATGSGDDTILAGSGDDTIDAGGGINSIDGGSGFDTLLTANFSTATTSLTITNFSNSILLPTGTWSINNIEAFINLSTGSGADTSPPDLVTRAISATALARSGTNCSTSKDSAASKAASGRSSAVKSP